MSKSKLLCVCHMSTTNGYAKFLANQFLIQILQSFLSINSLQGRLRRPTLALWVLKRHSRREEAFKEGNFSKKKFNFSKFYIFLVIPGSWGVHRYPWFQNRFINMARSEADTQTDTHELRFIIQIQVLLLKFTYILNQTEKFVIFMIV